MHIFVIIDVQRRVAGSHVIRTALLRGSVAPAGAIGDAIHGSFQGGGLFKVCAAKKSLLYLLHHLSEKSGVVLRTKAPKDGVSVGSRSL